MRKPYFVCLAALAPACSDGTGPQKPPDSPPPVANVVLDRQAATLALNGRVQLTAAAKDASGATITGAAITWTSSSGAATVSAQGLVTGVSAGTAQVTASVGSRSSSAEITVVAAAPGATLLSHSAPVIAKGQMLNLSMLTFDAAGLAASSAATFTSSDPAIASVDGNGRVAGLAPGSATIRVSADGRTMSATVTVVGFSAIASSGPDVCALSTAGRVYCAGASYGSPARALATAVRFKAIRGSPGAVREATHGGFCAIALDDTAYCWGTTSLNHAAAITLTPSQVSSTVRFRMVSPGENHSCGVGLDGRIYCWGSNNAGQLGNGSTQPSAVPTPISSGLSFAQVGVGSAGRVYSCALSTQGAVFCWGENELGWLGNGGGANSSTPVPVSANVSFRSISDGGDWICAVTDVGQAYCWGNMSARGTGVGTGTCINQQNRCDLVPTSLNPNVRFASLHAMPLGMCGLTVDGESACFGLNRSERFGVPSTQTPLCPGLGAASGCVGQPLVAIRGLQSLAGGDSPCAIRRNGEAVCWGDNGKAQLTVPVSTAATTPFPTLFRLDPNQ